MINFHNSADAYKVSLDVYQEMMRLGFGKKDCNMVATAVSEISTNALRYAGGGMISVDQTSNKRGIEIIIKDQGPGIKDVEKALTDGFSSMENRSLGVGLGAAKRAMDYFSIKSKPGEGTKVVMRKYFNRANLNIEYGSVSLPDDLREVNGDDLIVKEFEGDKVLMAVIDGLGGGVNARRSASAVKNVIHENFSEPLDIVIKKCNQELKSNKERGVTLGILLLTPDSIEYAGIGDTFIHVYPKAEKSFYSQPGIVGTLSMPSVRVIKAPFEWYETIIVMCTDGIHNHFRAEELQLENNARDIADEIMKKYRRKYGDATVLVSKVSP